MNFLKVWAWPKFIPEFFEGFFICYIEILIWSIAIKGFFKVFKKVLKSK